MGVVHEEVTGLFREDFMGRFVGGAIGNFFDDALDELVRSG